MADVNVVTEAVIPLPIADAAGYVADLANANGGSNITTLEWETAPSVGVGSRMSYVTRSLGRRMAYTCELVEYEPRGSGWWMRTAQGAATRPRLVVGWRIRRWLRG